MFNRDEEDLDEGEVIYENCRTSLLQDVYSQSRLNNIRTLGYQIHKIFSPDEENYHELIDKFFLKEDVEMLRSENLEVNRIFSLDKQNSVLVYSSREVVAIAEFDQQNEAESDDDSDTDSDNESENDSGYGSDSDYEW